jgi:type II secretory ATPase GspE/PulE/Tfp pilus assembly ATPase PilB-like protein
MSNFEDKMLTIKNENELPKTGKLISAPGDEIKLTDAYRKEILVWDISINDRKMVWILAVKTSYGSNNFMQICKNAEGLGYRIAKKGIIDINVLNLLYDRRSSADTQKATSDDSVVIGMFELILTSALAEKVSDIHIEVRPVGATVRMRKNGEMMEFNSENRLTFNEGNNLASVIYNVLASTKSVSFDPRDCQQAAVSYSIKEQELKLRYQSVPAYPDGYDVILRVLPVGRSEDFTPLQVLGYTEQQVEDLNNITSRPVGSLIIAGVTGSGKSTTMKNLLMYINANTGYRLKIYSIEDPPEYNIAKITQIPVVIGKDFDPTKMSPFEKPIKACMRGDPDIIMIGEVRDKITGDLTKKAIQSGHQVLTTVHATSGVGIIDRFQDFGLTRSVLGSPDFLTGLIYQKLMPIVCNHCCIDFHKLIQSDNATKNDLEIYQRMATAVPNLSKFTINKRSESGCEHCKGMGVKGRTVCAEVIMIDLEMMQFIEHAETIKLIKYWRGLNDGKPESENMSGKTCMEHAFQKLLNGFICPYDLESSFKPIDEMMLKKVKIKEDETKEDWDNI